MPFPDPFLLPLTVVVLFAALAFKAFNWLMATIGAPFN
jgi:hypothetical protein